MTNWFVSNQIARVDALRYIDGMTVTKTIMVVQSSVTGRLLLKQRADGIWGFASEAMWSRNEAMLFNGLNDVRELLALDPDGDDITIDFVGTAGTTQIFHLVIDHEIVPIIAEAEWCSLFNFPENFDPKSDDVFEHRAFLEKIVSPETY